MSAVRVEEVGSTRVEVRETGKPVTLRDEDHSRANHYIEQSRPYFPNTKLHTYINCPYFLRIARCLCFASLFGFVGAVGGVKETPVFFGVACAVFFVIYCQHEWVNQGSLPVVLRQPVFHGQERNNWFYEVIVTDLKGMALENYQAGIGFVEVTQGKIKFQAFNENAVKEMSRARCHSRLMLFFFFVTFVYNVYFSAVAYSQNH